MHPDDPMVGLEPKPETRLPLGADAPVATVSNLRLWALALAAALAAGLAAGYGGEAAYHAVKPVIALPSNYNTLGPYDNSAALADAHRAGRAHSERVNTTIAYGVLGGLLGCFLGLAGGLARGSIGGLLAAVVGLVAGTAVGAGMSAALTPAFYHLLNPESSTMMAPFVVHAGVFAPIGGVAGFAFGLGRGGRRAALRGAVGGFLGALLGAVLFEAAVSIAYPLLRVEEPIPGDRLPRLAVHLCVAVFTALGAALLLREHKAAIRA
jgi:hypothetical protein